MLIPVSHNPLPLLAGLALALAACGAETDAPTADVAPTAVAATPVPAGTYSIDGAHSSAGFGVRHLGISTVNGDFGTVTGTLTVGETLSTLQTTAVIDVTATDTGNDDRDGHLQSADFFDVAQYPEITFESTGVRPGEGDASTLVGNLTMHGVTKPVELAGESLGASAAGGTQKIGFTAAGEIDRREWGLTWAETNEVGEAPVGDTVTLQIQVEAGCQPEAAPNV